MVLRNVKAALAVCLTVASGYSISSDCSGRVVNGNCIPASPFDVTYEEFNQSTTDFVVFEDGFPFEIKIEATLSPSTYAFMQGMERYAEEMTEWYDRYERQMDEDYIESQNSNTSDATA